MRIAFRVDASLRIGLGHLHRCISLALALRELDATSIFVVRKMDIDVAPLLASLAFPIFELPAADFGTELLDIDGPPLAAWAGASWRVDSRETIVALADYRPDW